ncbi:PREDICTED: immunoglobulin lambda-like polypeptide 1, partial [Poecilia mexicana]|uniref:immunoglobulin lambda-like polypeptide 1 n=1 Tax=Poecilia mexicana TaxID=48701 RepID=UPI00072ECD4B
CKASTLWKSSLCSQTNRDTEPTLIDTGFKTLIILLEEKKIKQKQHEGFSLLGLNLNFSWTYKDNVPLLLKFTAARCLLTVQEVFVRPLNEFVSLWWTFGGGTKLIVNSGPAVPPSVSLLPPSSEQLSGGSATLLCLLSGYSPQGAQVSWEVDGTAVTDGVLSSSEEEKSGRYGSSSTLSLSQEKWMKGEQYSCRVAHQGHSQVQSIRRSQCEGQRG